ncbi:hypothetical protein ACHAWO_012365 [Cyclotella atomus]|uniref:JmjC domain-containing protein n=1 Tax=Cyclotella atomus TaxID=382360 RepID=A0ABD3NVD5_9STRA
MSKRVASEMSEVASNLSNAAAKLSRTENGADANPGKTTSMKTDGPVVVIHDYLDDGKPKSRRKSSTSPTEHRNHKVFDPQSSYLLDDMLYPLSREEFLKNHFRKNAVCIQRRRQSGQTKNVKDSINNDGNDGMVSLISENYLFGLDVHQIFAETSSQNVFLWLRPPPDASYPNALNSVEISDPDTAYALHKSGSHPAYCRAPPLLEQLLVSSLLRATGLGGGHYHPPHSETVTVGGNTTLGRGEVELFIGAKTADGKPSNGETKANNHTTGHHTDFQENFTIQISGVKQWTLRRGRVRHPLRATTPHYLRDGSVVENQLKVARLCLNGNDPAPDQGLYGFEYSDNNAYGQEQTVTLYSGDVLYFPSGMWHTVKTIEPGVSLNVSLMGTTYATVVCEALQHMLVGSDERWREIVTSRPGDVNAASTLHELMRCLSKTVDDFVTKGGGAQSVLPPVLCYPPIQPSGGNDNDPTLNADDNIGSDEEMDSKDGFEGAQTTPELRVDIDSFIGPPGWSCKKPPGGKLIKNPLALLLAKEEVTTHGLDKDTEEATKQYILNVSYAGNEMFDSHIRVTLVTEKYIDLMDSYLTSDAVIIDDQTPPDCLFFYGLFSWAG